MPTTSTATKAKPAPKIRHSIAKKSGVPTSVTVFIGTESLVASSTHPNFEKILAYLGRTAPPTAPHLRKLFDTSIAVQSKLRKAGVKDVSFKNGHMQFKGKPAGGALVPIIEKFHREGNKQWASLAAFFEKIQANPNAHSRDNLYRWLAQMSFQIHTDGDIVGYKGVSRERLSVSSGEASVNGKKVTGRIPNKKGSVITMPRKDVNHDPAVGCHTGLHVGTHGYAVTFAPVLIRVKVNPADVVSVPTECGDSKMRVCRYEVLEDASSKEAEGMMYLPADPTATTQKRTSSARARSTVKAGATSAKTQVTRRRGGGGNPAPPAAPTPSVADWKRPDFEKLPFNELRKLIKAWGVKLTETHPAKSTLVARLVRVPKSKRV